VDGVDGVPARRSVRDRLVAGLLRIWAATWRVRWHDATVLRHCLDDGPVVLAFWHEDLAVLGPLHADRGFVGMVSLSSDGDLLAGLLRELGYALVRGSSSRNARAVGRSALRALRAGASIALAVDGPRGPRRRVHSGASRLSQIGRVPVILVACEVSPAIRLSSWDRQRIPAPFARVDVVYSRWLGPNGLGMQLADLPLSVPT